MDTMKKGVTKQKYVDILTNGGFKAFFGDENNKKLVMSVINTFLPEHRRVVEIDYLPTEHQGPVIGYSKEFHYDFSCTDASGAVFIVEMQNYSEKAWFKRCVSYASRAYDKQNKRGEDYDVQPVYLIGLMGVDIDHPDKEFWKDRYISEYTFREKDSHDLLGETIVIIFAELAKFCKAEDECHSKLDRMLYLLKNSGSLSAPPKWTIQEDYIEFLDACEIDGFDDDKRYNYDKDMYDEKRRKGEIAAAIEIGVSQGFEKGHAEGLTEGLAEGLAKGHAKGHAEGLTEGIDKGIVLVAKNMLAAGFPYGQISQATGLDIATIEELASEQNQ